MFERSPHWRGQHLVVALITVLNYKHISTREAKEKEEGTEGEAEAEAEAEVCLVEDPGNESKHWKSSLGTCVNIRACTVCHSDAEYELKLEKEFLSITYACYRDLGPATDPNHPKWVALVTGAGFHHRSKFDLGTSSYARSTAALLCRLPSLYIHTTPFGRFDMSKSLTYKLPS
ncbi:hypothetical protein B0I35DRAFT_424503, partial [Stachybotrys elegans]